MRKLTFPWDPNPLSALLQVRSQRQARHPLASPLWPWLLGALAWSLAFLAPGRYPLFLGALFAALFVALPGYLLQRDLAQLRALRSGRCLEEMLAVGLTPDCVADTLAWQTASGLTRPVLLTWLLSSFIAAPVPPIPLAILGLAGMWAGNYLRQIFLLLADQPGRLLREGLKLYALTCLGLGYPVWLWFQGSSLLAVQTATLGTLILLALVRLDAIALWQEDLAPTSRTVAVGRSWAGVLADWCSNPILVRALRSSRRQGLGMWLGLPLAVMVSLGAGLPFLVENLGPGLGFMGLWLTWRIVNFFLLAERSRGLLQKERQSGGWELLVQAGLGGAPFVRGWGAATAFHHFGWILADALGLGLVAWFEPQWLAPTENPWLLGLWVAILWGLGLALDATAFVVGLAGGPRRSAGEHFLLPALAVTSGLGELALALLVGLNWLNPGDAPVSWLATQAIPLLALALVTLHLFLQGRRNLTAALNPLARPPLPESLEMIPIRAAQWGWLVFLLLGSPLAAWRNSAGWGSLALAGLAGWLVSGWLLTPLGWALHPISRALNGQKWRSAFLLGGLCAVPVIVVVEFAQLHWMFTGEFLAGMKTACQAGDLLLVSLAGTLGALTCVLTQKNESLACDRPVQTVRRLSLVAASGATLSCLTGWGILAVFPSQMNSSERQWWADTQQHLAKRQLPKQQWEEAGQQGALRDQFPLGQNRAVEGLREKWSSLCWDELCSGHYTRALRFALAADWAGVYLRDDEDTFWIGLVDAVRQDDIPPAQLEEMKAELQRAPGLDSSLAGLLDDQFAYQCDGSNVSFHSPYRWWPQALRLAKIRHYRKDRGLSLQESGPWWKHHCYSLVNGDRQLSRSRVWRALLLHRIDMAEGKPEWGSIQVLPGGEMIRVQTGPQGTTYTYLQQSNGGGLFNWALSNDAIESNALYVAHQEDDCADSDF